MEPEKTEKVATAETAPETTPDRLVKWLESGRYKEFIFWLAVLAAIVIGIHSQISRQIQESIWKWREPIAREFKGFWKWLTTNKIVVWTLRLYFGILILLTLGVPVTLFFISSKTATLVLAAIAATLVAIPLLIVYRPLKNNGKEEGDQSITDRLFASFNRFVRSVSVTIFLTLTATIFLIYLPASVASLYLKIGGYIVFVMLALLSIGLNARWQGGLVILLLGCILLLTSLGVFGERTLTGWATELRANLNLATIVSTQELQCYNMIGCPLEGTTIPVGNTLYVDFNKTITTKGGFTATRVYLDYVGGPSKFVILQKGVNYKRIKPGN